MFSHGLTHKLLRLGAFALLLVCALTGCSIFRRGRKVQAEPPPPFSSPISQPVGRPGMQAADIREALGERRSDVRAMRANLSITVGEANSKTRQQFDANAYSAPPGFLRIRGSADAGTLFDFLMDKGRVQVMVVPEKKVFVGTLADLRMNTTVMAGIQPDDLMNSFLVEQNLYRLLKEQPGLPVQETPDHFQITATYAANGLTETYHLRKQDLLVDSVDRMQSGRPVGSVRYSGYEFYDGKHLLPNRFDATTANGAQATVVVTDMRPNEAKPAELSTLNIPEGFERMRL